MTPVGRFVRRRWARTVEFTRKYPTVTAVVLIVVLVVIPGFIRSQQIVDQNRRDNEHHNKREDAIVRALHADLFCVENYINDSFRRAQAVTSPANARINLLFAAIDQAITHHHQQRALRLLDRAITENKRYQRAQKKHPLAQPQLACRLLLKNPPPPRRHHAGKTSTPAGPSPSPSVSTRHVYVPVVGPTTYVRVPGPTVTVTKTVTVTATVTVPPGHQK